MEGGGSFAPTDWTAVKGQANGPGREEARGRGSGWVGRKREGGGEKVC